MLATLSTTAIAMCTAGILVFVTGLWSSKAEIAAARGIEKVVTLYRVCFAIPLAVFGALHLCFSAMSLRRAEPRQLLARLGRDRGAGAAADLHRLAELLDGLATGVSLDARAPKISLTGASALP